jgi:hypothetical protein
MCNTGYRMDTITLTTRSHAISNARQEVVSDIITVKRKHEPFQKWADVYYKHMSNQARNKLIIFPLRIKEHQQSSNTIGKNM